MTDEVSPLRWEDGVLLVLDQRRLPAQEAWVRCRNAEQVADCIGSMAVRGAPAIGIAAAYGMALAARAGEDLEAAATLLCATRPTAVNLGWAVRRALEADEPPALAERLHHEQREVDRRLAELGAGRFAPGDRALTHCNTGALATGGLGTAGGVLRAAWGRGRLGQVWVDETRPRLQGARLTAWELRRDGIPFRVIADSAAGGLMARGLVDRVVVGADRIAANGDVANKVGTYPLAVLAARHEIPFDVVAPLSTIDPTTASGAEIPIEERDPDEVSANAEAFNPAFDVTPAELIGALVTEAGVLEPPTSGRSPVSLHAELIATAREMLRLGLVAGTRGNVSAREGDVVHVTPRALPYESMTEDDLVTLSLAGEAVAGRREPSSERRVHLAVYAARPEVTAVVHTHSVDATAWSFRAEPLDTGTEELEVAAGGAVRTAAAAVAGSEEIAAAAVAALAGRRAALLARHGVIGIGDSPGRALDVCAVVERQASLAWRLSRGR